MKLDKKICIQIECNCRALCMMWGYLELVVWVPRCGFQEEVWKVYSHHSLQFSFLACIIDFTGISLTLGLVLCWYPKVLSRPRGEVL